MTFVASSFLAFGGTGGQEHKVATETDDRERRRRVILVKRSKIKLIACDVSAA